jgi:hypothetical protein
MINKLKNHKVLVVFGSIVLLAAGSAAYAYWTSPGTGTGSAATGTNVAITVTQTTTPTGLYPGGTPASLAGKFNNGNASKAYVHEVSATISSVTAPNADVSHPCAAADYQLTGFPVTVDAEVDPGNAQGAWTGGLVELLDSPTDNQDGCKGATVNLAYTSN